MTSSATRGAVNGADELPGLAGAPPECTHVRVWVVDTATRRIMKRPCRACEAETHVREVRRLEPAS